MRILQIQNVIEKKIYQSHHIDIYKAPDYQRRCINIECNVYAAAP